MVSNTDTNASNSHPDASKTGAISGEGLDFTTVYGQTLLLVDQMHHRLRRDIQTQFDEHGWGGITPTQSLLMYRMSHEKTAISHGRLRREGLYSGSNVSYNLAKLIEGRYLTKQVLPEDRRSQIYTLTPKGFEVAEVVSDAISRHVLALNSIVNVEALQKVNTELRNLMRVLQAG